MFEEIKPVCINCVAVGNMIHFGYVFHNIKDVVLSRSNSIYVNKTKNKVTKACKILLKRYPRMAVPTAVLSRKAPNQNHRKREENCCYEIRNSWGVICLAKLNKNIIVIKPRTHVEWCLVAIVHVIGKDQVMTISHVYREHDVLSHEPKPFEKISNIEISYDKTWNIC